MTRSHDTQDIGILKSGTVELRETDARRLRAMQLRDRIVLLYPIYLGGTLARTARTPTSLLHSLQGPLMRCSAFAYHNFSRLGTERASYRGRCHAVGIEVY